MRILRDRDGVRLVDGPDLVSHLRATPGPTHGFFDLLAACIVAFAPQERPGRALLLGFAVGGIVAPLRGMGWHDRLDAVDRSLALVPLFRDVAGRWAGDVRVVEADAARWLRRSRTRWDVVVEDLTVRGPACAIKPAVSVEILPQLVHDRLARRGVVAINVLPVPGIGWSDLLDRLAAPHGGALIVDPDRYENCVLLAGPGVPAARTAGRQLRDVLRRIHSRQADGFTVRSL